MSSKISLCHSNTGHLGLRNETIVFVFLLTISALLGFTQVSNSIQYAEGAVSWNGFLKEVGFNPPSIYEVSGDGIILESEGFTIVELFCLDGDWVDDSTNAGSGHRFEGHVILPTNDRALASTSGLLEDPTSQFLPRKVIGQRVFVEYRGPGNAAPFDVPFTVTILCLSPSSFMTVGGEWQATDTTALIIGYSVLNAYWIAPIGIGIGVGVYLVKRKIE